MLLLLCRTVVSFDQRLSCRSFMVHKGRMIRGALAAFRIIPLCAFSSQKLRRHKKRRHWCNILLCIVVQSSMAQFLSYVHLFASLSLSIGVLITLQSGCVGLSDPTWTAKPSVSALRTLRWAEILTRLQIWPLRDKIDSITAVGKSLTASGEDPHP